METCHDHLLQIKESDHSLSIYIHIIRKHTAVAGKSTNKQT